MYINNGNAVSASSAIRLLRIIGSPFSSPSYKLGNESEAERLYAIGVKNRISQLYLEAIKGQKESKKLANERERLARRYDDLINAIGSISNFLESLEVENFIFKTVRPYLAATADIDLVILNGNYRHSVDSMLKAGYKLEENAYGPQSTTLYDPNWNIKLDIYDQIAVSHLIYLDKEKIRQYVKTDKIENGSVFQTLKPQADLVAIIGHSVIKEQMYCFGEYYTFLFYLASMKEEEIRQFIDLIRKTSLVKAAAEYIGVTAILHREAHGCIPSTCRRLTAELGTALFEASRIAENNFHSPHKYHILTVFGALIDLLGESKFRRSIASQLKALIDPSFADEFINELVLHVVRDTY